MCQTIDKTLHSNIRDIEDAGPIYMLLKRLYNTSISAIHTLDLKIRNHKLKPDQPVVEYALQLADMITLYNNKAGIYLLERYTLIALIIRVINNNPY